MVCEIDTVEKASLLADWQIVHVWHEGAFSAKLLVGVGEFQVVTTREIQGVCVVEVESFNADPDYSDENLHLSTSDA